MKKFNLITVLILGIIFLVGFTQQDPAVIIQKMHQDNVKELALATLAKNRASSEEIKNYANMLIQDHASMGDELAQFANELSVDLSGITIDSAIYPLDSFQALSPQQIEAWFKVQAIASHEKTISYFQNVVANDAIIHTNLKVWMKGKLPNLKSHLVAAQGLKTSVNTE